MIIGIGLIKLHQCKLGVVPCIKTLVTENAAYLIDLFNAADYQPLEVKLKGDTQLEILVKGVKMCLKGSGSGAAGVDDKHGGLHFHKSLTVKEAADRADDLRALDKGVAHLRVDNQVDIALTVARVDVLQSVILLRKRTQ